jgi:hypothetical protein
MKPNDEWFTADRELDECRLFAGCGPDEIFDLDPCCSRARGLLGLRPTALRFIPPEDDGLFLPWSGDVFCNPPYSEIHKWTSKGVDEVLDGRAKSVTFLLPANRTEQPWFQDLIYLKDLLFYWLEFKFLAGRRGFIDTKGNLQKSPRFGLLIAKLTKVTTFG